MAFYADAESLTSGNSREGHVTGIRYGQDSMLRLGSFCLIGDQVNTVIVSGNPFLTVFSYSIVYGDIIKLTGTFCVVTTSCLYFCTFELCKSCC